MTNRVFLSSAVVEWFKYSTKFPVNFIQCSAVQSETPFRFRVQLSLLFLCFSTMIPASPAAAAAATRHNVRATAILFRHGQRTPLRSHPTFNNRLTKELGHGQLTNVSAKALKLRFSVLQFFLSFWCLYLNLDWNSAIVQQWSVAKEQVPASVSCGWLLQAEQYADHEQRAGANNDELAIVYGWILSPASQGQCTAAQLAALLLYRGLRGKSEFYLI